MLLGKKYGGLPVDFGSSFFGKCPAMDVCPLLPECHGSAMFFDRSRKLEKSSTKRINSCFGSNSQWQFIPIRNGSRKKGVLIGIDMRGQSSKGVTIRISRGTDRQTFPDFVEPSNRSSNSPDLNPVYDSFWDALQQPVCRQKFKNIDCLKQILNSCWYMISQELINGAVDQWSTVNGKNLLVNPRCSVSYCHM